MSVDRCDVIVVGAGIAGLACARRLVDAALNVGVVEARPRVGGRLLSDDGLDLGATWFWPNEPRVQRLIQELGLPVHAQYLHGDAIYQDPGGVQRLAGNPIDVPAGRFSLGAESLAYGLADQLPHGAVELGMPADSVEESDDGLLRVNCGTHSFEGKHVVIALPPALALSTLRFSPTLPDRLQEVLAQVPVWMGAITKVVVEYPEAFWREEGLSGAAISHVGPLREIHDMSGSGGTPAALFGFASPGPGRAVQEAGVRSQLRALFGTGREPTRILIHDWRTEGFTSPPQVEGLQRVDLFGNPVFSEPAFDGRLHWASTETARAFPGHIEGALEAAERVADRILSTLDRPVRL